MAMSKMMIMITIIMTLKYKYIIMGIGYTLYHLYDSVSTKIDRYFTNGGWLTLAVVIVVYLKMINDRLRFDRFFVSTR